MKEPQPPMVVQDDWYLGFASALAEIWRLHHDGQMVRHLMTANGITLKHFTEAGVDDIDMEAIGRALLT